MSGDIYLARSVSGDFVVQTRQRACNVKPRCNVAIRVRYGDSVITVNGEQK
jgi:hypothetical protein